MNLYFDAGRRIRLLRERRHFTREELAEMVDISPKFLYEIETGKKGFSAYTLYKVAEVFLVTSDYILTGKETSVEIVKGHYLSDDFNQKQKECIEQMISIAYELCH